MEMARRVKKLQIFWKENWGNNDNYSVSAKYYYNAHNSKRLILVYFNPKEPSARTFGTIVTMQKAIGVRYMKVNNLVREVLP